MYEDLCDCWNENAMITEDQNLSTQLDLKCVDSFCKQYI